LRNIRSSYGAGAPVSVDKTSNGRMSEAQAALGLVSLDRYAGRQAHNRELFEAWRDRLAGVEGIRVIEPSRVDVSNHQNLVCEVDADAYGVTRDELIERLAAHRVESRAVFAGAHAQPLPGATRIGAAWMTLPLGAHVSVADIDAICNLIAQTSVERVGSRGAAA